MYRKNIITSKNSFDCKFYNFINKRKKTTKQTQKKQSGLSFWNKFPPQDTLNKG